MSLHNYKTTFYNCEHKHLKISSYDNYFTDQVFYRERIICADNKENCKLNAKNDIEFHMCLTCSKTAKRTKSYCSNCIKHHRDKNHVITKYEDNNYYCRPHIKKMEKYCFQCKKNLCEDCAKEHEENSEKYAGHQIKDINSLIPLQREITELKDSLSKISSLMESLQIVINDLIYTLNGAMRIYTNYYKSASHIIEKYESFNKGEDSFKNFTIFKCLYNLKLSNVQILEDLKEIIKENNNFDKAKYLIGIYTNKKKEYDSSDKRGKDLNKEDDKDWFKEVCERERERERIINPTYHLQI